MTSKERIWFIILFWIVMAVFLLLGIEVCRAQTPPAPVIDYYWQPNPHGMWLCNYDIYRVLQQHTAQDDTLHNRIDSITSYQPDSVFYAYYAAGTVGIDGASTRYMPLDTEVKEDGIYAHAAGDSVVAINSDGWYRVSYDVIAHSASLPTGITAHLYDYSSGWAAITNSLSIGYSGSSSEYTSLDKTILHQFTSGDSVMIEVSTSSALVVDQYGITLLIEKIH